jgi:fatty acid desaturase
MSKVDHRSVIANLEPACREALLAKHDGPGLARFAVHAGSIGLLGTLISLRAPLWWMLLPFQGVLIVFLFTLLHETAHETPFRTKFFNVSAGFFAGFLLLIGPAWFRYFHFAHHRHTHDPQLDPELQGPKPNSVATYLKHVSGIPIWVSAVRTLAANALGRNADSFIPPKARVRVAHEARPLLAAYGLLAAASFSLGSVLLIWTWIVPAILGQPFLRLYLLAEHTGCPHVEDMLENTRTTFTTRLVRLIAWNMPYHAEHHALPTVPFHKLPELHGAIREHLRTTANGYVTFNREMLREMM